MQPVREEALLEVEPQALDGIEANRAAGHERDIGRHAEPRESAKPLLANAHQVLAREGRKAARLRSRAVEHKR